MRQRPPGPATNQLRIPPPAAQQASASSAAAETNGACAESFHYGAGWANRLPAEFPAYPGGRITEAAGNDSGRCRVVTFTTADGYKRVLEHHRGVASRAGFTAEHQVRGADHVLGGTNTAPTAPTALW